MPALVEASKWFASAASDGVVYWSGTWSGVSDVSVTGYYPVDMLPILEDKLIIVDRAVVESVTTNAVVQFYLTVWGGTSSDIFRVGSHTTVATQEVVPWSGPIGPFVARPANARVICRVNQLGATWTAGDRFTVELSGRAYARGTPLAPSPLPVTVEGVRFWPKTTTGGEL